MIPLSTLEVHALKVDLKTKIEETFTKEHMIRAVETFLDYGEETFNPYLIDNITGHQGYFSGSGWAARAMRCLLKELKQGPPI